MSRTDAFARLWPKLRAGYLLDALERLDGTPTAVTEFAAFIADVDHSLVSTQPSVGLGEDLRRRSDRVIGSGLVLGDETIQLSAFRSERRRPRRLRPDRAPEREALIVTGRGGREPARSRPL